MVTVKREIVERDESQLAIDAKRLLRMVDDYAANRMAEDPASSGTIERRDMRRVIEAAALLRATLYGEAKSA